MAERSRILDFLAFLGSVRGDLAKITAPPFFLAPQSVTECGSCWTERPALFIAPALEPLPQKRALLVLKWILVALKSQLYVGSGGDTTIGIKKPLNAILGELYFGQWADEVGRVDLTAEQISHHPPMTAVYMRNEKFGITGEGYTRVEMTSDGSISIVQTGHAVFHIEEFDEDHLIFLPNIVVKGFLSRCLYPELRGTYHIVSSAGYVTELRFLGPGAFSFSSAAAKQRNTFEAKIFQRDDPLKKSIYTAAGCWSDKFAFFDLNGQQIDAWDHSLASSQKALALEPDVERDEWETQRVWKKVFDALADRRMLDVVREKSSVEESQRQMRRDERVTGKRWEPLFSSKIEPGVYDLWARLASAVSWKLCPEKTNGVWKYDHAKARTIRKPFHDGLSPTPKLSKDTPPTGTLFYLYHPDEDEFKPLRDIQISDISERDREKHAQIFENKLD